MVRLRRIAGLFGITIFAALVTGSASAECNWSNQITIHPDGMEWQYTEKLSDLDSYVFKYDIDNRQGNKDHFVSTWELMKGDKWMRERFRDAIEREMDVRIDNSSLGIEVLDIDASLSKNALGPVNSMTELTNTYRVTYSFPGGMLENGSTTWFLGEPGSLLSVNFPEGTQIISTKGIDNVSIRTSDLSGKFGAINECINATESEGVTDNVSVTVEGATDNVSVTDEGMTDNVSATDEGADAKGAEITYIIYIVLPPQNNLSEEPEENESTIPVSTDIPFPGTIYVLLVIAAAVLLSKD
ncbi:MAG: hypothetical protein K8R08_06655 [Methanosarcinales archaeon]|nr:hypothetical protein [Methanosarcinales archaeon]